MEFTWLETVHERAFAAGIPLHFKQYGSARNNPVVRRQMAQGCRVREAWDHAVKHDLELAPKEKGGATYKGAVYRQKPTHYHRLVDELNPRSELV